MIKKQPWAVLVCRASDDNTDPAQILVKDLGGLNPDPNDTQTVLDLFKMFFTKDGNNTFNMVRYFNEMSHGSIDLNDSQVFVVDVDLTKEQLTVNPPVVGFDYAVMVTTAAQQAAVKAGVQLQNF